MVETKPSWIKIKSEELKKIVVDMAKEGESAAKIGLVLRDKHGVPRAKLLGQKITKIIKEAKVDYQADENRVKNKISNLKKHLAKNKHDYTAKRSVTKNLWIAHHMGIKEKV